MYILIKLGISLIYPLIKMEKNTIKSSDSSEILHLNMLGFLLYQKS